MSGMSVNFRHRFTFKQGYVFKIRHFSIYNILIHINYLLTQNSPFFLAWGFSNRLSSLTEYDYGDLIDFRHAATDHNVDWLHLMHNNVLVHGYWFPRYANLPVSQFSNDNRSGSKGEEGGREIVQNPTSHSSRKCLLFLKLIWHVD